MYFLRAAREDEREIGQRFGSLFLERGILQNDDSVLVRSNTQGFCLSYWNKGWGYVRDEKDKMIEVGNRLDIQKIDDRGYILHINIDPPQRRKKLGTRMSQTCELFFIGEGCEELFVTPSGQGKHFWPRMGFVDARHDGSFLKRLTL